MESTLTAFYTPPVVIKGMYEALGRLGFSEGSILEPSCGTGNFFGLLPDTMAGSKLHGVEIDPLTGKIAKQLYQKANIAVQGFEETKLPDDHFDVVIGNVPFGDFKKAREARGMTREQLSGIIGYAPRHIQSIENEGKYPSIELFIQLITMFDVSVDEYIFPNKEVKKSSVRRRLDAQLDNLDDKELSVIEATVNGLCKAKEPEE